MGGKDIFVVDCAVFDRPHHDVMHVMPCTIPPAAFAFTLSLALPYYILRRTHITTVPQHATLFCFCFVLFSVIIKRKHPFEGHIYMVTL